MKFAYRDLLIVTTALGCAACDREPERLDDVEPASPAEIGKVEQTTRQGSVDQQKPEAQQRPDVPSSERQPVAGREPMKVELKAAEGVKLEGHAEISESDDGVKVVLNLTKAPPGKHGAHIHEKANCSDIEGESMGGHYNPQGDRHGLPENKSQAERHLGDLGNIEVDDEGEGQLEFTIEKANLKQGDKLSLLDRSIVVHQGEDQGAVRQPAGGSGKPIACGVIPADVASSPDDSTTNEE